MSASADAALVQLNKWKSDSALLYLFFQGGGMTAWCIGVLSHVSSAELHFRMKHGDGQDLLFAMNIHTARFEWPDASDAPQFFATKPRGSFGKTLVMHLEPGGRSSTVKGRVALAEFYPETLNIN